MLKSYLPNSTDFISVGTMYIYISNIYIYIFIEGNILFFFCEISGCWKFGTQKMAKMTSPVVGLEAIVI